MSYPPGSLRSCHEADGRSDRSGGSGGTGSGSGCGNVYGSLYGAFSDCKWHHQAQQHQQQSHHQAQKSQQQLEQVQSTWQKWAASFDALLSDGEGVALFKSYLESEGCGNLLDFWFAIQGFRSKVDPSDRKKILQLIKVIYQTYIRGSASASASASSSGVPPPSATTASRSRRNHTPVRLRPETRRSIADRLAHKSSLDQTVFDEAQAEVGHLLRTTAYQAFLKSEAFIAHIQQGGLGPKPALMCSEDEFTRHTAYLPTVEEDRELGQAPLPLRGSSTPATYHYFCGPPMLQQQCACQSGNPWGVTYYPPPTPQTCYPPAPLTQENIQMTRFQRAELPVPQHLACCPHCQTPLPQQQQIPGPSNPLSPTQHKSMGRMTGAGQRKWMDAVCPKYEYCSPPLAPQGGFARAPPNPYHVSFAPVSMQDSEHHSLSSGAHTEENLSHIDGACDEARARMHLSSIRHTTRISTNYPVFETSTTTTPAAVITSGGGGGGGSALGHKHKRGVSSSRRAAVNGASTAAAGAAATSKTATLRDQNMAELDPSGFARLLNERLQRVVEDRAAMERLERLMSEVGNDEEGEETTEIPDTGQEKEASTKTTEAVKVEPKTETEIASATKTQQPQPLLTTAESEECSISKAMANLSVASTSTTTTTTTTTATVSTKPSVLQRPWADRLLAAARVQHAQQGDNAQAILEDHCSRIWDTSADRTPTSSSGSGGDGHGAFALRPRLDAVGKSSGKIVETSRQATTGGGGEEEEVEDDCIHPPLLQESSSPPSATTTTTTNSSTRFDFHQQVNESQLVDVNTMRLQARCTASPTAPSTTGGGGSVGSGGSSGSGGLVVGYYLCDDPVPYRSQWPSNVITLGQFKHLVPKKGLFRFFFKTTSDEFDSGVVHQEISNDDAVLPLWEGKVVAKVERVEQ
uniref:Axis inhibition protein axin n=1 Tax=Echinococcus granulosus TaxID=6210 RepID=A0A068WLS3_ECHGR|nr:axis inhibition protein axin [Echinococcus granulosus]